MPLPRGLTDIGIRRATREDREVATRALYAKDWPSFYRHRDAILFTFENGQTVELSVSAPGLNEFLRGVRAATGENTPDTIDVRSIRPQGTPLEEAVHQFLLPNVHRPPPRPASEGGPKTVWDRIRDEEDGL